MLKILTALKEFCSAIVLSSFGLFPDHLVFQLTVFVCLFSLLFCFYLRSCLLTRTTENNFSFLSMKTGSSRTLCLYIMAHVVFKSGYMVIAAVYLFCGFPLLTGHSVQFYSSS